MDMLNAYFDCGYGCDVGLLRQLGTSFLDQLRKSGVRYTSRQAYRVFDIDYNVENNDDTLAFYVRFEGNMDDFGYIHNLVLEYFLFLRGNFPHIRKHDI